MRAFCICLLFLYFSIPTRKLIIMKKNYYLLIFLLPAYLLLSYSSGAPFGYSGSPGDNGRTCNQCHVAGSTYTPDFVVDGIPANGYTPGQTYQLTLTVNNANSAKKGFEACVEDDSHQRQGSFANADTHTQAIHSNEYVTHTSSGTTQSAWTFNWTAPATAQGNLTLYFAVNIADGNGSTSEDFIDSGSVAIPLDTNAMDDEVTASIHIYPNPTGKYIMIQSENNEFHEAVITDILGKTYPVNMQNKQIDIRFLPSGSYILSLTNTKTTITKRFIKK